MELALQLLREQRDRATTAGDEDCRLFFEAELRHHEQHDYTAQSELMQQALAWQTLRDEGSDPFLIRQAANALSILDRVEEAIALYDQALAINPKDHHALRNKEVSLYNLGKKDGVFELIKQAAFIRPDTHKDDFFVLTRLTGKDAKAEWERLSEEIARDRATHLGQQPPVPLPATVDTDPLSDIRGFVARIRTELADGGQELLDGIKEANKLVRDFLLPESKREQDRSEFLILRKWNSYTPAIPTGAEDNRSRGGGYFIYHQGKGIVIDPGYNFIENFHESGGRIHDINSIVITHAHNDHTTDFESLCTLLYKYNKDIKELARKKRVSLYLNSGAFKKFSGILNLQDHTYIGSVNENEIEVDLNMGVHECLYPNHLGVIGVCRMITKVRSRLAIVSEFGEELRSSRCFLVRQIDRIVKEVLQGAADPPPVVLPGDLTFRYDIGARKVYCCESHTWIACEEVRYRYKDFLKKEDIYYLSREAEAKQ